MSMKRRAELANVPFTPVKVRRAGTGPNVDVATSRAITRTVRKELAKKDDYKQCRGTIDYTALGVSSTGTVFDITSVLSRGDTAINNFEGSKIFPKSFKLRYRWMNAVVSGDSFNLCRVMIVQWMGDTTPSNAGAFIDPVSDAFAPLSGRLWTNKPYMRILYDHTCDLVNDSASGDYLHYYEAYIPSIKIKPIEFFESSALAHRGRIFVVCVTDSNAAGHPHFAARYEMVFTD